MLIRSILRGILFIFAVGILASPSTANAQSVTVTGVNPSPVSPGNQVTVSFTIAGAPSTAWAQIELEYADHTSAGSITVQAIGNGAKTGGVTVNTTASSGTVNAVVTIMNMSFSSIAKSVNNANSGITIQ
jgi:fibronectin type 3 domain-containing protein